MKLKGNSIFTNDERVATFDVKSSKGNHTNIARSVLRLLPMMRGVTFDVKAPKETSNIARSLC